ILRASTVDFGNLNRQPIERILEHATQHPQRIAAALMDIDTRVATLETKYLDAPTRPSTRRAQRNLAASGRPDAARATDADGPCLLVVQVQEVLGLQQPTGKFGR